MATFTLTGSDTIKINDRIIADIGHGEVAKVSFSNDIATVKTGKSGNTIFSQNASGFQATMELKVIRGSADDKFMQTIVRQYKTDPVGFVLVGAELVKKLGDGTSKLISDTYVLVGGVPSKQVEVVSNVEGDVEQVLSVYTLQFANSDRAIA